jgi:segregation and condensation protein B
LPKYASESPTPTAEPPSASFDNACPELFDCTQGGHYRRAQDKPSVTEQREFNVEIKRVVEAILFAANRPMTCKQLQQVFPEIEQPDLQDIEDALESIKEDYRFRPVELKQVASGYRFQVRRELSRWVSRLFEEKPPKYSRALLETLAIIAYRQPATRGDIEDIRGVSVSSSIIHTLLEREWIRVVAHKEVPGRPALYGTTKQFLDYFNITSLSELPTLQEIQELGASLEDPSLETTQQPMQVESEEQETTEQSTETIVDSQEADDGEFVEQPGETVA